MKGFNVVQEAVTGIGDGPLGYIDRTLLQQLDTNILSPHVSEVSGQTNLNNDVVGIPLAGSDDPG
jgi:hypothetical protein